MLDPRNLAPEEFAARARETGASDASIRRLMAAVIGRGILDPWTWGRDHQIPRRLRDLIVDPLPRLGIERSVTSAVDGFQKLLFRTGDGLAVEAVLIPLHKRGAVSVCLSSQVGCAMGCVFCATARIRARRSLETWEIVDQFIQAREVVRSQGRRVTGAVFMGMGEPFLNYDRVLAAADLLRCPFGARSQRGRSRSVRSGSSTRSTGSPTRGGGFAWRSAWAQRRMRNDPGWCRWQARSRSPR